MFRLAWSQLVVIQIEMRFFNIRGIVFMMEATAGPGQLCEHSCLEFCFRQKLTPPTTHRDGSWQ